MKAAIADVVRAAQRSDRHGLLEAVRAAAGAAGVDASGLNENESENEVHKVVRQGQESAIYRSGGGGGSGGEEGIHGDNSSIQGDGLRTEPEESTSITQQTRLHFPAVSYPCSSNDASQLWSTSTLAGCLRPRLNYRLWVNVLPQPPAVVMPFIGAARYTFRGHLYWTCTEYLLALCRVVTMPHSPPLWFTCQPGRSCPTPQEAEHRVWTHVRHTPAVPSVGVLQAMAEEQKGYSVLDYESSDTVARHEEPGSNSLGRAVEEERHGDPSMWMSITELERYVRRQLGSDAFSRLERTIGDCCMLKSSKGVNEDLISIVQLLMKNLAESFICFGDGPQWRTDAVSTLFQDATRT